MIPASGALWHRYAWLAYLAVFVGVLGHATTEFVAVLSGVAGPPLSVWRFLLGGLGLVVVALAIPSSRDLLTPLREAFWPILGLSLFWFALGYLAFHWSLDFATVPQVATTVTAAPIFVALMNQWTNRQPISTAKWVTGICALLGVALLVTDGALQELRGSGRNLLGIGLAIACAILVGGYSLFARPVIVRFGALRITTLTTVIGAVGLWLLVGLVWGAWVDPGTLLERDAGQVVALLTLAFWNTTIAQWLWLGGLAAVPDVTRGIYLFFLKPVIAASLALFILGQPVTWLQWLAIFVICGAVALEASWTRLFGRRAPAVNAG